MKRCIIESARRVYAFPTKEEEEKIDGVFNRDVSKEKYYTELQGWMEFFQGFTRYIAERFPWFGDKKRGR